MILIQISLGVTRKCPTKFLECSQVEVKVHSITLTKFASMIYVFSEKFYSLTTFPTDASIKMMKITIVAGNSTLFENSFLAMK